MLFILFLVSTLNFLDRAIIGIIAEPIRKEFQLSDFQLGLLGGPAFAVLYSLLGLIVARLAEHSNRISIVSGALAVWSAMTALCGMATTFPILLLARMGVSVGEAGCVPPAQSILCDYYPPARHTRVLAIYSLGIPVGTMAAAAGGGWLAQHYGWRTTLLTLGLIGLIIAPIVRGLVSEPPRLNSRTDELASFSGVLWSLKNNRTFCLVVAGSVFSGFSNLSMTQYLTAFFTRVHKVSLSDAALASSLVLGIAAAAGMLISSWILDRRAHARIELMGEVPSFGLACSVPLYWIGLTAASLWIAVPSLAAAAVLSNFFLGAMYGIALGVAEVRIRATASAVLILCVNLLGYSLGPLATGFLSDFFATAVAHASIGSDLNCGSAVGVGFSVCESARATGLQNALLCAVCGYLVAAIFFFGLRRTIQADWKGRLQIEKVSR